MESYPEQCRTRDGRIFVRDIGNEIEKSMLVRLDSPRPGEKIASPLVVKGFARGQWFFEGVFPLILTDWDGRIIAESYATAQGEWMTENFVPFRGVFEFEKPAYGERGSLILQKNNPSGLLEHDDALEIPIFFGEVGEERAAPKVVFCESEQRGAEVCIALYQPVCGQVNIQCIKAPCQPVYETFSNSCVACANPLVESYTKSECVNE
ncbi:MAG: hypothetical protein COW88_00735 [Candidatus Lloydbacteria bacterium CG22_combo_CG10-13_8_21_14_all_47_15]|uniref:Bacterial spore germination immunoglobulin-like domain-containing protein n=1 Tax=Candidatus Lloydbacteria bacterium CG22_combo_CG10-13_8_21_14_all_47_15 TaxID=1974635 RepID=A0A2H0CVP7_9BACT|nr:MAG: hypothetical protein COW88_00735 [Candidatus Lloydbacteria bacterium CG22_combo_CG10-13_8_21_14_all_47_15]